MKKSSKSTLRPTLILIIITIAALLIFSSCGPQPRNSETLSDLPEPAQSSTEINPEEIRSAVINYLIDNYEAELGPRLKGLEWEVLPQSGTQAFAVYGYQADEWKMSFTLLPAALVDIEGETLTEDTFDISLSYLSPPPFIRWSGRYSANQGVIETGYAYQAEKQAKIAIEQVRDIAQAALKAQKPKIDELDISAWDLIGTQEGLGETVYSYISSGWTVTVVWSEFSGDFSV